MNYSNATIPDSILNDRPALEFPDWSGMQPHQTRLSPAEAFRWNEGMLSLFPEPRGRERRSGSTRCEAEFIL